MMCIPRMGLNEITLISEGEMFYRALGKTCVNKLE